MLVDGVYQWEVLPSLSLAVNCEDWGVGEFFAWLSAAAEEGGAATAAGEAVEGGAAAAAGEAGGTAAADMAAGTAYTSGAATGISGGQVMAAGAAVSAGTSLYSALNAPKMPSFSGFQTSSTSSQDTEAAAYAQMQSVRNRRGASSTILTGPLGIAGTPSTQRATLGT